MGKREKLSLIKMMVTPQANDVSMMLPSTVPESLCNIKSIIKQFEMERNKTKQNK